MKRYILFASLNYYPQGGMDDFIKDFETLEEAKKHAEKYYDTSDYWAHIYDVELKKEVWYK